MSILLKNKQRRMMLLLAVLGVISNVHSVVANLFLGRFVVNQEDPDTYSIGASISFLTIVVIILWGNTPELITRKKWIITAIAAIASLLLIFFKLIKHSLTTSSNLTMICIYGSLAISVLLLLLIKKARRPGIRLGESIRHLKKQISIPITYNGQKFDHHSTRTYHLSKLKGLTILKDNGTITEDEYQLLKTFLS
jgi:hypothetical protein